MSRMCSMMMILSMSFFFFQAEDGIRDVAVTGVQTCALPISFPTSLLREGEAIGADERSEIGGDFRGDFLEFVAGGVAGQLKTLGGNVGSHGEIGRASCRGRG